MDRRGTDALLHPNVPVCSGARVAHINISSTLVHVFDTGVTDVFINRLPVGRIAKHDEEQIVFSIQSWVARVREHYRRWE